MFGMFARAIGTIIQEAAGATGPSSAPTYRLFSLEVGCKRGSETLNLGISQFDYDNQNAVKADKQLLTNGIEIAYNGKTQLAIGAMVDVSALPGDGAYAVLLPTATYKSSNQRYFKYNSIVALSPVNRKIRHLLPYFYTQSLDFNHNVGGLNYASTTSNNNIVNNLDINIAMFPYLKSINFNDNALSSLTIRGNHNSLQSFVIEGYSNLLTSLNGKLPASTKYIVICSIGSVTSITNFIANAVNCESLLLTQTRGNSFGNNLPGITGLSGSIDLSFMTKLKEFAMALNNNVTSLTLPLGKTDWTWFKLLGLSSTASASFSTTILENLFASPNLRFFVAPNIIIGSAATYNRDISDADIASSLSLLVLYYNKWTGNVIITTSKPNLKDIKLGNISTHSGNQQNIHTTVDVSGCTNLVDLDISGCNTNSLNFYPSAPILFLALFDTNLDFVTDSTLLGKINSLASLQTLYLSNTTAGTTPTGLNSVNGLGTNPDFSANSNLIILAVSACNIVGSLTLYNGNKLTSLYVTNNANLTSIVNLNAHTGLVNFICASGCTSLNLTTLGNTFTALSNVIIGSLSSLLSIDLSGKITTTLVTITVQYCANITAITLPTTQATALSGTFAISNNGSLTALNNMSNMNYVNITTATNVFNVLNNNLLNITFPIGVNNFIPNNINVGNNGMSQANVDATIDSIYTNAAKWDTYTAAKTLNIAGTSNASPSGTYQYAATPSSGKEKIYYLVNTKGWTITYN